MEPRLPVLQQEALLFTAAHPPTPPTPPLAPSVVRLIRDPPCKVRSPPFHLVLPVDGADREAEDSAGRM